MPEIKAREVAKGTIKTLDKAAIAGEQMKDTYVRTKEKVERHTNPPDNSPEEYAANRISETAAVGAVESVHPFDKVGRWGVRTTKENISKAKEHLSKQKSATEPQQIGTKKIRAKPRVQATSPEQWKADQPKKQACEKAISDLRLLTYKRAIV